MRLDRGRWSYSWAPCIGEFFCGVTSLALAVALEIWVLVVLGVIGVGVALYILGYCFNLYD